MWVAPGRRAAWNGWYHCTFGTHWSWIRGDERGWRSRHHREHVEEDYKSPPPPGSQNRIRRQTEGLKRRERVDHTPAQRKRACELPVQSLQADRVEVIALCAGKRHVHVLVRFQTSDSPYEESGRRVLRRAKGRSAYQMSREGMSAPGGVWAKRCRIKPVRDRRHQVVDYRHILDHAKKGAAGWDLLQRSQST